jgi:hypothetical protein
MPEGDTLEKTRSAVENHKLTIISRGCATSINHFFSKKKPTYNKEGQSKVIEQEYM